MWQRQELCSAATDVVEKSLVLHAAQAAEMWTLLRFCTRSREEHSTLFLHRTWRRALYSTAAQAAEKGILLTELSDPFTCMCSSIDGTVLHFMCKSGAECSTPLQVQQQSRVDLSASCPAAECRPFSTTCAE